MLIAVAQTQTNPLILRCGADAVGAASKDRPGSAGRAAVRASRLRFAEHLSMRRVGGLRNTCTPRQIRSESSFPVQRRKCDARRASFRARWPLARSEDPFQADLSEIRAIAAGDSAAFQRLIDREAPRLVRFAYGMLGSLDEAEDAVQDTLIRLWENAASWTPDARIGTWLHRVCYNRAIDALRRRRAVADESVLDDLQDERDLPDAAIVRSETILSVRDAIERLPARQRTAVLLFHFQDFSQRDAAGVMGISEDAFESMLARARRQLKRLIGDSEGGGDV
jgi:RNA polymerase sigma-70 factor, ECF subfamily